MALLLVRLSFCAAMLRGQRAKILKILVAELRAAASLTNTVINCTAKEATELAEQMQARMNRADFVCTLQQRNGSGSNGSRSGWSGR